MYIKNNSNTNVFSVSYLYHVAAVWCTELGEKQL